MRRTKTSIILSDFQNIKIMTHGTIILVVILYSHEMSLTLKK